ncbi:biotin carboxylase C-terminal domain-containing protein [Jimgerdemannia flammicorona]|uniref:Biotin carboxylase C-terminal domain-containing protein n=1 Tax=Jimgerdemannia flammicorona TaxID=994334 RepID=A0A433DK36_9FUNG|nr:biotin carboxylase C-terminal domain-containing protein [Jimgerdemannia flammicorona]
MIAKLVVRGEDRTDALRVLRRALGQYQIVGLNTNIAFLKTVAEHPEFIKGEVETGFIQQYESDLLKTTDTAGPDPALLAVAANAILLQERAAAAAASNVHDPHNPFITLPHPLRINAAHTRRLSFRSGEDYEYTVELVTARGDTTGALDVRVVDAKTGDEVASYERVVARTDEEGRVVAQVGERREGRTTLHIPMPAYLNAGVLNVAGSVKTPMPCKISQVLVVPGQVVEKGATLVILEAMKMEVSEVLRGEVGVLVEGVSCVGWCSPTECNIQMGVAITLHVIKSPFAGKIETVAYKVGDLVPENKSLVTFAEGAVVKAEA